MNEVGADFLQKELPTPNCLSLRPPGEIQKSSLITGPVWSYHQEVETPALCHDWQESLVY